MWKWYVLMAGILAACGWTISGHLLFGQGPHMAALAGIAVCMVACGASAFLPVAIRAALFALISGAALFILFVRLSDTDIIGTGTLLAAYLLYVAVFLYKKKRI